MDPPICIQDLKTDSSVGRVEDYRELITSSVILRSLVQIRLGGGQLFATENYI